MKFEKLGIVSYTLRDGTVKIIRADKSYTDQLVICGILLCVKMLSNQGFVSSLLTDEMYERENFDFQQLFTQIS